MCACGVQVADFEQMIRQLTAELKEANDRYDLANERIANLQQLQADIEQAHVKVTGRFVLQYNMKICRAADFND